MRHWSLKNRIKTKLNNVQININQEGERFLYENFKERLKKTLDHEKTFRAHEIGRIIVKMTALPKDSYKFSVNPIKIPELIGNLRRPQIAKIFLSKKYNVGVITIPVFLLYYKTVINNLVLVKTTTKKNSNKQKTRHVNKWSIN